MRSSPRSLALLLLIAAAALAQERTDPPKPTYPLTALREKADKTAADWESLAQTMDARTARWLPCDPRIRAAIDELSRASEARLAALAELLSGSIAKAKEDALTAQRLLDGMNDLTAEIKAESADAQQLRAGLETQANDLTESATQRASLQSAKRALADVTGMLVDLTPALASAQDVIASSLRDLAAAYQARQSSLENELGALTAESARWSAYYAARLARAKVECSITKVPAAPKRSPGKKKQ
jgi:DNA repair exonuclease SbcCD ATPase subunit